MIMEELQAVLSEQESFPPRSYQPFISPQDIIATARGQAPTASVPSLGTSAGQGQPEPLGTSGGTSTPIEYGEMNDDGIVDSLRFIDPPRGQRGVVSPIPSAAQAAATPKVYSGGYSYVRDDAGGFKVTKDGKAAGYAKPGSPEAQSIAAEIGGGVYDPEQQRFMQRATAADVMPGENVSTRFRPDPEDPFGGGNPAQDFMPAYTKRQARAMARSERASGGLPINLGRAGRQQLRSQFKGVPRRGATTVNIGDIAGAREAPAAARRDIEEMIYEALLEEFGNK